MHGGYRGGAAVLISGTLLKVMYPLPGLAPSCPQVSNQVDGAGLVLSLESKNSGALEEARTLLLGLLPRASLVAEQRDCPELSSPLAQEAQQVGGPFQP